MTLIPFKFGFDGAIGYICPDTVASVVPTLDYSTNSSKEGFACVRTLDGKESVPQLAATTSSHGTMRLAAPRKMLSRC